MMDNVNINEHASIAMHGTILGDIKSFKYIGSTIKYDGLSENKLRIQLTTTTSEMIRLDTIWRSTNIRFPIKFNLYKLLILSILLENEEKIYKHSKVKRIEIFRNKIPITKNKCIRSGHCNNPCWYIRTSSYYCKKNNAMYFGNIYRHYTKNYNKEK